LEESLEELKKDHKFLLEGNVFTKDFIDGYINYKLDNEITPWRTRPNPLEFVMYYSV